MNLNEITKILLKNVNNVVKPDSVILLKNVNKNNLKNFSVSIPLKKLVAIVGPSGSGKSTLIGILQEMVFPNIHRVDVLNQKVFLPEGTTESLEQFNFNLLKEKLNSLQKNDLLVVDEPLAGFCKSERDLITKMLKDKTSSGFSVIAVEHNKEIIEKADYIIELGPGAGKYGGKLIFEGDQKHFQKSGTITSKFVYRTTDGSKILQNNAKKKTIKISNIKLKGLSIRSFQFPLNEIVCLTGKMDSGKSILLDAVYRALYKGQDAWEIRLKSVNIDGKSNVRRSYWVPQKPLEVNDSNFLAKYMDVWDKIEELISENKLENILKLTIDEAIKKFPDVPIIQRKLGFLKEVGLGYTQLGQKTNTFSGGEAQRIRMAKILTKKLGDRCVYIFDTPSRGLHPKDLPILISVFKKIIAKNNSILIADNQEEIFRYCDERIEIK